MSEEQKTPEAPQAELTQQELLDNFAGKMNEFMSHVTYIHNRLFEVEKAVGYLLTKDKEWMEAYQKAQKEAEDAANVAQPESPAAETVFPE